MGRKRGSGGAGLADGATTALYGNDVVKDVKVAAVVVLPPCRGLGLPGLVIQPTRPGSVQPRTEENCSFQSSSSTLTPLVCPALQGCNGNPTFSARGVCCRFDWVGVDSIHLDPLPLLLPPQVAAPQTLAWGRGGEGNILVLARAHRLRIRSLLEEEVVEGAIRAAVEGVNLVLTRLSSSSQGDMLAVELETTHILLGLLPPHPPDQRAL
ncbi:hypothetical protein HU200_040243 [Digitaria exilis]|uniref:Uncharacterized protein n=1 Tax=Digitaria exilis TaxID=1010633 RepID=A0A835B8C2_9POAL|nr:hypothetical protein HU200_040243 [Digitaria exilis]